MGIYFLRDLGQIERRLFQCLFCEVPFETRQLLNDHYLTDHAQAFTEPELKVARSGRARS